MELESGVVNLYLLLEGFWILVIDSIRFDVLAATFVFHCFHFPRTIATSELVNYPQAAGLGVA